MKNLGGRPIVLYGGRTVHVMVAINTNESEEVVAKRIHLAARGPNQRMAVTSIAETELKPEFWKDIISKVAE